jgi:adenylate cyclase
MDSQAADSMVLGGTISTWLAEQALLDSQPAALYAELCERLRGVGFPVVRGQVAFRVLHPLYDASAIIWTADKGTVVSLFRPDDVGGQERFERGPLGHALARRLPVLRRRLTGETALVDFVDLEEFRAQGGTDYVLFLVAFESEGRGIICSWLADRAAGFTDNEIVQLQRITRELSIAMKSRIERSVAHNVAHAYLGKRAGEAVLNGSIRRGDGEKITAALWYSDLRQSTTLADRLSAEDFLGLLGRYFEMTASAVLDAGGEVVSLIGDAVLGLFRVEGPPHDGGPQEACRRALGAAHEARRRLAKSVPIGNLNLDFGIALHLGQVIHGNVGVPERLSFTVVGSAVNEVVRVQELTKQLSCPLLATAPFAAAAAGPWRPVGEHVLRGLETPMPILAVGQS